MSGEETEEVEETEQRGPVELQRMSDDELKKWCQDLRANKIFSTRFHDVPEDAIRHIWMVMALAGPPNFKGGVEDVGDIWEYYDAASPVGVNGWPTFFSARFMHRDDTERARKYLQKLEQLEQEATLEE